jgi:hypothetical protein
MLFGASWLTAGAAVQETALMKWKSGELEKWKSRLRE